jgi:hypothetical protein
VGLKPLAQYQVDQARLGEKKHGTIDVNGSRTRLARTARDGAVAVLRMRGTLLPFFVLFDRTFMPGEVLRPVIDIAQGWD